MTTVTVLFADCIDSRPWSSHAIDALTKYDSMASNIGISIAFCSRVTYRTNNPVALEQNPTASDSLPEKILAAESNDHAQDCYLSCDCCGSCDSRSRASSANMFAAACRALLQAEQQHP